MTEPTAPRPVDATDARAVRAVLDVFAEPKERRGFWESSQWSGAIIAVVTVVVTSIATQCTQRVDREAEAARADRLAATAQMRGAGDSAYASLAGMLRVGRDWLTIARGDYDQLDDVQLRPLVDSTNAMDRRWRTERHLRELSVAYHFDGTDVPEAWRRARAGVDSLHDCAERAMNRYRRLHAPPTECAGPLAQAGGGLDSLEAALVREYRRASRPATRAGALR